MKKKIGLFSVGLSGFLVYIFDKIWGDKINWEKFSQIKIGEWLSYEIKIKVLFLLLIVSIAIILYLILKNYFVKDSYYNRKQRKLRKFNQQSDIDNGLLFKWNVYFDDSGEPFISDLSIFCTKHNDPPLKLLHNDWGSLFCSYKDCKTIIESNRIPLIKNTIESHLIDQWSKIK